MFDPLVRSADCTANGHQLPSRSVRPQVSPLAIWAVKHGRRGGKGESRTLYSNKRSLLLPFSGTSTTPPPNASPRRETSTHFLSREMRKIHTESEDGDRAVEENSYEFPVDHGHQSLVSRCPEPIPGAVERVGDGRAQHVVQVHFCGQTQNLENTIMIDKHQSSGKQCPPEIAKRLRSVDTSFS